MSLPPSLSFFNPFFFNNLLSRYALWLFFHRFQSWSLGNSSLFRVCQATITFPIQNWFRAGSREGFDHSYQRDFKTLLQGAGGMCRKPLAGLLRAYGPSHADSCIFGTLGTTLLFLPPPPPQLPPISSTTLLLSALRGLVFRTSLEAGWIFGFRCTYTSTYNATPSPPTPSGIGIASDELL